MTASKDESAPFANDKDFLKWLNGVFEFNKKSGLQSMQVKSVGSAPLGKYHFTARVTWSAIYSKAPDEEISFDLLYVLSHRESNYRIVLYISDEDQEELMKEKGLL